VDRIASEPRRDVRGDGAGIASADDQRRSALGERPVEILQGRK
jgi:hypothetical protein